ncbi:MAG: tetratricopeptide repeat protein [Candidatus Sumerlaeia bacterium]|nr:tetratricopeptide repeat protein [Candidatus Sumerlaeia bacterium]
MEEADVVQAQPGETKPDLYSRHVQSFVNLAEKDFSKALEQFGFSVWHSLSPKDAAVCREKAGLKLEYFDYYNRGTAAAMENKWAEAVADLRAALKADPDFAPAAYNLALCLEKLERFDEAREAWRNYLKILDRVQDRTKRGVATDAEAAHEKARVQQHLESLGKN